VMQATILTMEANYLIALRQARAEVVTVDLDGNYATGLVEGDKKGRREGHRIGYAEGQRDALAALREADSSDEFQYEAGQRDALAAAIERVEGLPLLGHALAPFVRRDAVIAAIKGDSNPCAEIPTPKLAYREGEA